MSEYISREAAIKALENVDEEAYAIVSQLHAADVAPVVEAEQIYEGCGLSPSYRCSVCGGRGSCSAYCSHCGAVFVKRDGKKIKEADNA